MRLSVGARHGQHDDLHAMHLSLFYGLCQVVIARDQEEHVRGTIAGVGHKVEADAEVDSLLLAVHPESAKPELDLRQFADAFLLRVRNAIAG